MITMIGGRAGEGKTTFARFCQDHLIEKYEEGSAKVPFAMKVKDTAFFMGWDGEKDDKGRKLLQEIGNCGRQYDIDLWAGHTVDFIKNHPAEFKFVFIDDWRFPNEGKYVQEHFYPVITVRIRRPEEFHTLKGTPLYNDVSEISLPDENEYYDYVIENDGSLSQLEARAEKFVNEVLIGEK
jgi:hypothetical protein